VGENPPLPIYSLSIHAGKRFLDPPPVDSWADTNVDRNQVWTFHTGNDRTSLERNWDRATTCFFDFCIFFHLLYNKID
jgi:hypothetical protein